MQKERLVRVACVNKFSKTMMKEHKFYSLYIVKKGKNLKPNKRRPGKGVRGNQRDMYY